jgi:GDPmannose 4,6-dehydratase
MIRKAFVTGILGQVGFYFRNILLKKGYSVIGFDRRITAKHNPNDGVEVLDIDLTNYKEVLKLFKQHQPSHVFNLAGVSNVFDPWQNIDEILKSTVELPHILMRCIANASKETVFCQASSCLVFGNTKTKIQSEITARDPIYPYGFSKNFIDQLVKGYREEKGLNCCSAIFYNHDSPFRGERFFIKKLINFAKSVKLNKNQTISFTDLNIKKDLGYAKDYMEAFVLMAESNKKDDYIISSGQLMELTDIVKIVSELSKINLFEHINIENIKPNHDTSVLFGDNSKIKKELQWSPCTNYKDVVQMIWEST